MLAIVLAIFTLAALGLAIANLVQESDYTPATDGAGWTETPGGLRAYLVPPDTPAYRAGVHTGDTLTSVNDVPIAGTVTIPPVPNVLSSEPSVFKRARFA